MSAPPDSWIGHSRMNSMASVSGATWILGASHLLCDVCDSFMAETSFLRGMQLQFIHGAWEKCAFLLASCSILLISTHSFRHSLSGWWGRNGSSNKFLWHCFVKEKNWFCARTVRNYNRTAHCTFYIEKIGLVASALVFLSDEIQVAILKSIIVSYLVIPLKCPSRLVLTEFSKLNWFLMQKKINNGSLKSTW